MSQAIACLEVCPHPSVPTLGGLRATSSLLAAFNPLPSDLATLPATGGKPPATGDTVSAGEWGHLPHPGSALHPPVYLSGLCREALLDQG